MLKTTITVISAAVAVAAALVAAGFALNSQAIEDHNNCLRQSHSRVASNHEIRIPLRDTDRELGRILRLAAKNQPDVEKHDATIALAVKFEEYAAHVKLLAPLEC